MKKFRIGGWFAFIISILLLIDLTILLDISFLRQILGFLFLTILPGLLILQILKLDKLGFTEKFVLSMGLSISFLMFFGLLLNNSSLSLGYETPLATIPLLISFNLVFVVLAIVGYKINKDSIFSLPDFNLSTSEKAFLIVPVIFPTLSIFGMHVMNTTDNNIILIFLPFLISIYVVFVCLLNRKFPKRMYPVVIFLISISLLFLLSLRSNHIIGSDIHVEYYLFRTTLDNLHWYVLTTGNQLDACLSISILPTIYQSILNIPSEFLFKIFYSLIHSITPLVIYILSKKYVGESYAFLASCFFMFQHRFILTSYGPRTGVAILFFGLAMMTLFNDKIDPLKKRIIFIIFMASCMVSHYSTTYIFFFIMLGSFVGMEILSKKYTFKNVVSLTLVVLFFSMIFFWYSQVTETAFNAGVGFIENTFKNLHEFFILESRGSGEALLGGGIMGKGIPHKIEFVFTWLTFALIGIGVASLLVKRKEMSFPELNFKKQDFLKDKFEVGYFMIALACAGLLVIMIALPFIAVGYSLDRLYAVAITILSVFFVIGGITLSKNLSLNLLRKVLSKTLREKKALPKKQKEGKKGEIWKGKENGSQVRGYLIILLVLIPYFLCVTGVTYQMFGYPRSVILNSEGEQYDLYYVHDQESCCAKWLGDYAEKRRRIYSDWYGYGRLVSQSKITPSLIDYWWLSDPTRIDGYIYLRYQNIVTGELIYGEIYNMTDYFDIFFEKNEIYDSGCSKILR